jgi:hypothetical protein
MRYLCMHKTSPEDEAEQPPTKELIEGMGALIGEMARGGVFLDGGGLRSSTHRYRLRRAGGGWELEQGPFAGSNELPAGLAIIKTATWEQALDWGRRFGAAVGAEELELGLMTEEWDLGLVPRPDNPPLAVLIQHKATAETEAGRPLPAARREALAALTVEMVDAGVLQFHETLEPSSEALRLRYRNNDRTIVDGPFSESKELIGGFCLMQVRSVEELLAFCDRYVRILGGTRELDLRPVASAPGSSAG